MIALFQNRRVRLLLPALLLLAPVFCAQTASAQQASGSSAILTRDQAGPLLPPTVFYRGQVASIQARNSAGLKFADSKLVLATIVDTSGYATSIQQTYQGYLITEVPLQIGDAKLAPGAYGFGFVSGTGMVAMDLGGNRILTTPTTADAKLTRPNPLQILPDPSSPTRFRLYLGRNYVTLQAENK